MQRVVFLVDMNAFFISCEMTRNPSLTGKPAAVAGNPKQRTGIILAANYEARARGVKTAMVLHEALKLCPGMLLVPPDHHFYTLKSQEVMDLLSHYTPIVEQNSIDEAWLDMSGTEGLFGKPLDTAQKIQQEIRDKLGLWSSIGIAENKFLAKMASEMKKPLGITELWPESIRTKLWPLPVKAMYGVGGKTGEKLHYMGIKTIGELAAFDPERLVKGLGKNGLVLHRQANGLDSSPVVPRSSGDMKSIGRSTTLPEDLSDLQKAKVVLMELAEDVGITARKHYKRGCTVQITLKYANFQVATRQKTVSPTCSTKEIYRAGYALLEENWNPFKPVRLIGISLGGFADSSSPTQLSFFGDSTEQPKDDKEERIDRVMDNIRHKHGAKKITRATLIKKE